MADFFTNNPSFIDRVSNAAHQDLMNLQMSTATPQVAGITTATDPLLPDRTVTDRLGHLDPTIYDLTPDSHLMRLFSVLLGGAGVGGLRKQVAVARLQNAFNGTHFLDLDRFWGALFGIQRTKAEVMPDFGTLGKPAIFDPYTDAAGSDAWDDVHSRDASYRDRLVKFAKAVPLGGTYPGLKAAAEALLSAEVEIYESWTWVDELSASGAQPPGTRNTYSGLAGLYPTWADVERNHTWNDLTNEVSISLGRVGQNNRGEVLIQPKRPVREDERYQVTRTLNVLRPAGTQVSVDPQGLAIHSPVPLRHVAADSEYWEVVSHVTPQPTLIGPATPVYDQPDPSTQQPRPAFSCYQGEAWAYNNDIVRVLGYQMLAFSAVTVTNFETVVYADGKVHDYLPSDGLLPGSHAYAARIVADGVMTSRPFAGPRNRTSLRSGG